MKRLPVINGDIDLGTVGRRRRWLKMSQSRLLLLSVAKVVCIEKQKVLTSAK
jgi:hypothetical protein